VFVEEKDVNKEEKANFSLNKNEILVKDNLLKKKSKRKGEKHTEAEKTNKYFTCDVELTNDATKKHDRYETHSVADSSVSKSIFKTLRNDDDGEKGNVKKMMKLLKNRISARKCRQKKKQYYDSLEGKVEKLEKELEKYKAINKQKNLIDYLLENLEVKEKEIAKTDKNKTAPGKEEYRNIQKNALIELYRKILKAIMPIEYNVFASKFIKFNDITTCDNANKIVQKISENQDILDGIYDLKNDFLTKFNSDNLTLPQKFFIFFEKLKHFTQQFSEISDDLNNFE